MTGYAKFFGTLVGSSLWRDESKETKIVWITLLAMMDRNGIAHASLQGLADFAKVSLEECRCAVERLESGCLPVDHPEVSSKMIERVEDGWRIVNHTSYRREIAAAERRAYLAEKQKEHRERIANAPAASKA